MKESDVDPLAPLPKAIDTAFALDVTIRVPRQVVMDNGVKVILKVNAFTQAVSANENSCHFGLGGIVPETGDTLLALCVGQ